MRAHLFPRNRHDVVHLFQEGLILGDSSFLFFYGHTPKRRGVVDKSCFSQWFPSDFKVDSIRYPTAEHFMMAEKARLFGDNEVLQQILVAEDPKSAKALGRSVANFDSRIWNQHCESIVVKGNIAKFSQNRELRDFLLATGSKILVEASRNDKIWGIGMDINDTQIYNPECWRGDNLLGFALIAARAAIAEQQLQVESSPPTTGAGLMSASVASDEQVGATASSAGDLLDNAAISRAKKVADARPVTRILKKVSSKKKS